MSIFTRLKELPEDARSDILKYGTLCMGIGIGIGVGVFLDVATYYFRILN
jgi:hypothetical protein